MKKIIILLVASLLLFGVYSTAVAQNATDGVESTLSAELTPSQETELPPQDQFFQAKVLEAKDEDQQDLGGYTQTAQKVKLKMLTGLENGKEIEVVHGGLFAIQEDQKVAVGDTVIVTKTQGPQGEIYYITDKYRIPSLAIVFAIFFALTVFFGRKRGLFSIAGLLLSIFILIKFVIPQILAGRDPVMVSLGGALAIAVLSLYMAHGVNKRTTVALVSTVTTLLIATISAIFYVKFARLSGTGSEEAIFLQMGPVGTIDLKGLLLGGIIIGALGVLDDITTAQSATVEEIKKANPNLGRSELFKRGLSVGREHIASLVNTLVLAYAGASFPLLLLFSVSSTIPFWLTLNSEFIAEEVIRTIVGSTALVLAVPISTFLAAHVFSRESALDSVALAEARVQKSAAKAKKSSKRKTTGRRS